MKKKTVIIIIVCALLATVIVLGTLGTQKRNRELDAVGNAIPPSELNDEQVITSNTNTSDDATCMPTKTPTSAITIDGIP